MDISHRLHGPTRTEVESRLSDLLLKSRAQYALIVDLRGFILLHQHAQGTPTPPSLESLASLIAANFSATVALAKLFGENGFRELTQQGQDIGTYTEEMGAEALLVTVFGVSEPLGRVKYLSKKTVEAILEALAQGSDVPPEIPVDADWEASEHSFLDTLMAERKASKPEPDA